MNRLGNVVLLLYTLSLFFSLSSYTDEQKVIEPSDVCITVFAHGIISIQPYLSLTNIVRLKCDRIADTLYSRAVELTRKDAFFYQHHAMQGLGLQKIDLHAIAPGKATTAFAHAYHTLAEKTGYAHEKNLYYTFGWSGLLSKKMRTLEAEILYKSLSELLEPYHKKGIYPKLRIIGYSHGGRVALELAVAQYLVESPIEVVVDELILIGMPVSPPSIAKIKNPIFTKVYHIYSEGDRVQRIDFFSVKGFLSNRTFKLTSCYDLPDKLIQINFKFFRLSHFYRKKWCSRLPHCKLGRKHLRMAHPGHVELWSFGWTPANYRQCLPYCPLPAAAFIPYVIQSALHAPCTLRHTIVEIHPYNSSVVVKTRGKKTCCTLPFLTQQELTSLKNDAFLCKPENFTREAFEEHSYKAREEARAQKKSEWLKKRGRVCCD